jgi:hypothetical protein
MATASVDVQLANGAERGFPAVAILGELMHDGEPVTTSVQAANPRSRPRPSYRTSRCRLRSCQSAQRDEARRERNRFHAWQVCRSRPG